MKPDEPTPDFPSRAVPTADDPRSVPPGELLRRALETPDFRTPTGPWTPPEPEEMARLLPQYEIEKLQGHGGMGAVYQGRQTALDRTVAIKLLPAEMARNPEFVSRFRREAQMLAKLQHPGIVTVYDFGQTHEGHLYFVMEFVEGTDLYHYIHNRTVSAEDALNVTVQICEALQYAHSQGVIHRDIKPANVLIARNGRVKLADFGLARPLREPGSETGTSVIMGTPAYMAPEQRTGQADHRADIYALGVMLYEMLTGKRPEGAFDPPSRKVQVDVRLDEVVLRALQQEPERRYQEVDEMRTDVERIRTGPVTTPAPAARPPRAKPSRSSSWLGWAGAAVVAALVVFGVLVAGGMWKSRPAGPAIAKATPPPIDQRARDLCFLRDEWNAGVPLLAVKGGAFQEAAAAEMEAGSASTRAEAARRWIAAGSRVEAPDRWHCYRRARALFREALASAALQRDPAEWNAVRSELERVPTLKAKLKLDGRSYFREKLNVRQSSGWWHSEEANGGYIDIVGLQALPQFSHGGGPKTRKFTREEIRRILPEGLDFSTARIESASFGATTGSASKVLGFDVQPNGTGFELWFGEINAAKVRYPGNFTFHITIAIGGDNVNVPTPMPIARAATPAPASTPSPTPAPATPTSATPPPSIAATPSPATPPPQLARLTPMATPAVANPPPPAPTSTPVPFAPSGATPAADRPPVGVPSDAVRFGAKWYRIYLERVPWKVARDRCWQVGGRLAMPQDAAANTFIQRLADGGDLWLGASRDRGKTEWFWLDGKPLKFTAWIRGEPNTANLFVGMQTWRGGWADQAETTQYGFICEWPHR